MTAYLPKPPHPDEIPLPPLPMITPSAADLPTPTELLILRGLHLLLRVSFAPGNEAASMKHVAQLAADIGPWFTDYAEIIQAGLTKPGNTG